MSESIFVLGAAITDYIGFPFGQPTQADSIPGKIKKAPGGVGRNLSENLARLNVPVELVTAFGDDEDSKNLVQKCQEQNIGIRYSLQIEGHSGATNLAILDQKYDLFAGLADIRILQAISPAYLESHREALEQAAAIVVETNLPAKSISWLMEQEWDTPLYLDPVSATLASHIAGRISRFHTVKMNRTQAETIGQTRLHNEKDMARLARQWLGEGVRQVYITLGSQGAFAANKKKSIYLPAANVKVENTTGAGDAFFAGLIWANRRSWPIDDCCRAGLAASTIAVRSPVANHPGLNETAIMEYIRKFC